MKRKGQMEISFGMIFSIILIVAFLALAFYGIKSFLSFQEQATISQFKENFQNDLDAMYMGSSGSQEVQYRLPKSVTSICFSNDPFGNFEIKGGSHEQLNLEHLEIIKTLEGKSSLCLPIIDGKVKFLLEKNYGEAFATVKKISNE